jgi:hypothetical protein
LLLPPVARLSQHQPALDLLAKTLGRADALPTIQAGRESFLRREFGLGREAFGAAALTRTLDARDAERARWLRADPAHVHADLAAVRLLACGGLRVTPEECGGFARVLKPLFGDAGFEFSAPHPDRWYLRALLDGELPECDAPELVLGADIAAHLPRGTSGSRFRHLLNEAQISLHQHPLNEARIARGLPAVNSVWFWGGGAVPANIKTDYSTVVTVDPALEALARLAGVVARAERELAALLPSNGAMLADLQELPGSEGLICHWLQPALDALGRGDIAELRYALSDGRSYRRERRHRWRFWRRPVALA